MTVAGKLELLLKINVLPTEVTTDKNGWKQFVVDCGPGKQVSVTLRPKHFTKLTEAAASWPQWVATIGGQMGAATATGFVLLEPNPQVFERKAKAPAAPPAAPPPSAPEPPPGSPPQGEAPPVVNLHSTASAEVPPPLTEAIVRPLLAQRLATGERLEALCTRIGVPLRRVQELVEARPSQLTPAQQQTLLRKLHAALAPSTPSGRPPT